MHLHRLALRSGASLLAALLIAASLSASAIGAPVRSTASSIRATTGGPAAAKPTVKIRSSARKFQARHTVNVARLARQKPSAGPTGTLPFLTRTPATAPSKPRVVAAVPPAPANATTNGDPAIALTPFDGMSSATSADTSGEPPDPWVAVGPDHILQAVNLQFRITDRQGGNASDVSMFDFFGLLPGMGDSDPHVIYDSLHGRWIATEVSWDCDTSDVSFGHGYIDLAFSETTDPNGFWDVGFITFPDALPDYPAPGTSSDKIGLASNVFAMTSNPGGDCLAGLSFAGGDVLYMDWADLLNGGVLSLSEFFDPGTFTPRVAVQAPATSPVLQQIGGLALGGGNLGVEYQTVIGSVAGHTAAFDADWDLTTAGVVTGFSDPPQPTQPGPDTIANAIDLRPTDAVWQGNRFVFVSTYPCGTGPRDCVRVSELNTAAATSSVAPTLKQDFLISASGKDYFMGGVGLSGDGTLHIGWTRSSSADNPSSYAAHQVLGDTLNSISSPEPLAAGTGAYGGERWGDYVGIAQDPQVPNQVWNANEYSGGADWLTKVTPLQTDGTTYVPITPTRVLDTRFGTGLSGMFSSGVARSWQVANFSPIPADAVAVTGNLTVTGQQSAGYVSVTVTPTNSPPSSTINFPTGVTRANNVTIPLASNGKLSAVFKGTSGKKTNLVFDVTGYFLADTTGGTFTSITPIRAIDTRFNTGLSGKFDANVPRTMSIAGDVAGVPGTATAITGNFTIVAPTKGGYASVTTDPIVNPATSTINFPAGVNQANGLFAPLNGTGDLSIVYKSLAGAKADVLLDITGYFEAGTGGLTFVPLNPSRIMDTRTTAVLSGHTGKLTSGTPIDLDVDGHWGVPVGTTSVTGNLTVVGPQGSGFLSMTPTADPNPATSSLNFQAGDTMANGVVGPLDTGNSSFTYKSQAGKKTDLILDLSGYFE